jgi:hypothetical protein
LLLLTPKISGARKFSMMDACTREPTEHLMKALSDVADDVRVQFIVSLLSVSTKAPLTMQRLLRLDAPRGSVQQQHVDQVING